MAKSKPIMTTIDVVVTILIFAALISYGTAFWFDFNLVEWLSFGMNWLLGTISTILAVVGTIWTVRFLMKLFK
jgi:hypothetical protein